MLSIKAHLEPKMDVPELAVYLSISEGMIRKLIAAGAVPYLRVGRRIIFDRREIDAWLRSHAARG